MGDELTWREPAEQAIAKIPGHLKEEYGVTIELPQSGKLTIDYMMAQVPEGSDARSFLEGARLVERAIAEDFE
jgi:hypothetical protein